MACVATLFARDTEFLVKVSQYVHSDFAKCFKINFFHKRRYIAKMPTCLRYKDRMGARQDGLDLLGWVLEKKPLQCFDQCQGHGVITGMTCYCGKWGYVTKCIKITNFYDLLNRPLKKMIIKLICRLGCSQSPSSGSILIYLHASIYFI